jgi:hypothetical protein
MGVPPGDQRLTLENWGLPLGEGTPKRKSLSIAGLEVVELEKQRDPRLLLRFEEMRECTRRILKRSIEGGTSDPCFTPNTDRPDFVVAKREPAGRFGLGPSPSFTLAASRSSRIDTMDIQDRHWNALRLLVAVLKGEADPVFPQGAKIPRWSLHLCEARSCGSFFFSSRVHAKTCSHACRSSLSRKRVTDKREK